jgi:hypothetical protein
MSKYLRPPELSSPALVRRSLGEGGCGGGVAPRATEGGRRATRTRSKGWPPERRARQAARARLARPWRHSTGPRTEAGKARVAMNALRHGCRSRAWQLKAQRIRRAIRLCAQTILLARVLMRQCDHAFGISHTSLPPRLSADMSSEARPVLRSSKSEGGRAKEDALAKAAAREESSRDRGETEEALSATRHSLLPSSLSPACGR